MEVDASQLPTAKPSRGTQDTNLSPAGLRLRDCHPLRCGLPTNFGFPSKGNGWSCNPTSPQAYRLWVRFGLSPFRSPLLRGSLLVSFPPPTKMFPLGGFPLGNPSTMGLSPMVGSPIRRSPDLRLHAPPRGLSQLATSFFGARAEPSTGRLTRAQHANTDPGLR